MLPLYYYNSSVVLDQTNCFVIFVVFLIVFLATPNVITHIDPLSGVCVDVYNLYLEKFLFFASKTFVNRFNVIVRQFF